MKHFAWERWAAMLICLAAIGAASFLAVRYLLPIFLPFLLAWILSLAVRPMARRLSAALHLPKGLCAGVLLVLLIAAIAGLCYLALARLLGEAEELVDTLIDKADPAAGPDFFATVADAFPILHRLDAYRESINHFFGDSLSSLLISLSSELPGLIGRIFSALPDLFFVILVTVVAGFYFCTSERELLQQLLDRLPSSVSEKAPVWRGRIKRASGRFLRAYLLLLLLTFVLLLVGFLILCPKYALLLALLIALVDLLPVLGVGTVLIPWSLIALLSGEYFLGVGLLILYVTVLVVHQLAEPKLLGKSLGLHPVPTLFATFAGWRLFGFWGMLLGPIVAVLLKSFPTLFPGNTPSSESSV